ncbi:GtrA-like protein [Betaproteobacteria bacterium]|nr:GtrA-like protein [Betaproteobacteria bacterium]
MKYEFFHAESDFKQLGVEVIVVARFGLIGIIATCVHVGVVWVLLSYTTLHTLIANAIAFLVALGFSFSGHYVWTFRSSGTLFRAMRRFLVISGSVFALNTFVLATILHTGWVSPFISTLIAIFVIPVITFLASRFWGFAK